MLVLRTEAAARCELHGHYVLAALPQSLTLKDAQSQQPLLTWPYPFLRKFGQDQVGAPSPGASTCRSSRCQPLTLPSVPAGHLLL